MAAPIEDDPVLNPPLSIPDIVAQLVYSSSDDGDFETAAPEIPEYHPACRVATPVTAAREVNTHSEDPALSPSPLFSTSSPVVSPTLIRAPASTDTSTSTPSSASQPSSSTPSGNIDPAIIHKTTTAEAERLAWCARFDAAQKDGPMSVNSPDFQNLLQTFWNKKKVEGSKEKAGNDVSDRAVGFVATSRVREEEEEEAVKKKGSFFRGLGSNIKF